MAKKYKVLGNEGDEVEIGGVKYPAGVAHLVELEDDVAEAALAESKVEAVAEESVGGEAAAPEGEAQA